MNTLNFLSHLKSHNIVVWVEGEQLRYRASEGLSPQLREELRSRKAELMQFLGGTPQTAHPPIEVVPRDQPLEPSPAQRRLMLLEQLEGPSPTYNIGGASRLMGSVDVSTLKQALAYVIERHESLRTSFVLDGDEPRLQILKSVNLPLEVIDLQETKNREEHAQKIVGAELLKPFSLAQAPLFGLTLLRLSSREHILITSFHHIICDGQSLEIFHEELSQTYKAIGLGETPTFPALPVQYADFAAWQNKRMKSQSLEPQRDYWRRKLVGMPELLAIPSDGPRPSRQSWHGACHVSRISADTAAVLRTMASRSGTSLYTVLLTAYSLLLKIYTGRDGLPIGCPNSFRNEACDRVIGFLVSTLVLRLDLSANPKVSDLLRRNHRTLLDAMEHQDLPFEQVVEVVNPQRNQSYTPLIQTLLVLLNGGQRPLLGQETTPFETSAAVARFDLTLEIYQNDGALDLLWLYNTDLFENWRIQAMSRHLDNLLGYMQEGLQINLNDLSCLDSSERQNLVVSCNQTDDHPLEGRSLPQLFRKQAAQTPQAIAVSMSGKQDILTYADLDRKSGQLAYRLKQLGVGADSIVAVGLEREPLAVVAILAVLKAGGAFLNIDPSWPEKRRDYVLRDASVKVWIGKQKKGLGDTLIQVSPECGDDSEPLEQASEHHPRNLAYLVYTSGSTGTPKGVLVCHQGLSNYLSWMRRTHPLNASDRLLHKTSLTFDVSVWEMFLPLISGAHLVLAPPGAERDLDWMMTQCREERITVLPGVPTFLRLVATHPEFSQLQDLRMVFAAGEALTPDLVEACHAHEGIQLINGYGPSETSIVSVAANIEHGCKRIPIGRPVDHTRCYLLDGNLQLLPFGVMGQLYIAGQGLARGYASKPALTAERFVPNPFGPAGSRMYATGDLVRYLPGEPSPVMQYMGRMDHQVKLRGFRLELGEIEACLEAHPQIRDAAVMLRHDLPGNTGPGLVAYVVGEASIEAMRKDIKGQLPAYMVPAHFMKLSEFPTTASGKLDRKSLPIPNLWDAAEGVANETPHTNTEMIVAETFAQVLGRKHVGLNDNFFDAGGHSLLATRVMNRLGKHWGLNLPARYLFEQPSVKELAHFLDQQRLEQAVSKWPSLTAKGAQESPLSFTQQRLWFIDNLDGDDHTYNLTSAFHIRGPLKTEILRKVIHTLIERHEILRTRFIVSNGEPRQVVEETAGSAFIHIDLREIASSERQREMLDLLDSETSHNFKLDQGDLFRVRLIRMDETAFVLILNLHHIISDAWSTAVMVREISALYRQFAKKRGSKSGLAPLPVQFSDFARWQREWLSGDVRDQQLAFWKDHLSGAPTLLQLPSDHPAPAERTNGGQTLPITFDKALTRRLNDLARAENVTLFMLMRAAFAVLLYRYSGQDDFVMGSPIANRVHPDLEGLIGFFANTLAIRADLRGNPSFKDLLERTRQTMLGAYENQDLPFEQVVEAIQPERSLSHTPLFQVVLAFQNTHLDTHFPSELELEALIPPSVSAKFDLTMVLGETDQCLKGVLEFRTDLFERDTITGMIDHFQVLLEGIAAQPETDIAHIPLFQVDDLSALLARHNDTHHDYPKEKTLGTLFRESVARDPEGEALRGFLPNGDCLSMSRKVLADKAQALAIHLIEAGVRPDQPIGLCLDRSPELIVAILAIIEAGAAYVALDPQYPDERLSLMIGDAGIRYVYTSKEQASRFANIGVITTEETEKSWGTAKVPNVEVSPAHLAYISYTSGSTGRPKGVAITHRNVVRLICGNDFADLGPEQVFLALAPTAFDASTLELWAPLLGGGTLVLGPPQEPDLDDLAQLIVTEKITTLWLTAGLFHLMVEEHPEALTGLHQLLAGGDVLSPAHVMRMVQSNLRMINGYGPTENTTFTCCHTVSAEDCLAESIPIGKPIANTRVYVLSEHMEHQPMGVPGQLFTSGDGLARGYMGQARLTAERFVPNPMPGEKPGSRLYATGDQVKTQADGTLKFLGRVDRQVKIRGHRVEPGEVEAQLATAPQVSQVATVVHRDAKGTASLYAYLVCHENSANIRADIEAFMEKRLPKYMKPDRLFFLEELPLNANGKVDRNLLRQNDLTPLALTPLETNTEQALAGLFISALDMQEDSQLYKESNFFELGGHSLLATRLVSRIRRHFELELPLRAIFEWPTLSGLAAHLDKARFALPLPPPPPILAAEVHERRQQLSFAQERMWFLNRLEPENPFYNVAIALELDGHLCIKSMEQAWQWILERHEILRTIYTVEMDKAVPRVVANPVLETKLVDISHLDEADHEYHLQQLAIQEGGIPFDLKTMIPLRITLLRIKPERHILLLTLHHVAADGWSLGLLVKEATAGYEAYVHNLKPEMAELQVQYADFAVWQRNWFQGETLQRQLDYWTQQLDGAPPLLELPYDRPRPPVQSFKGSSFELRVDVPTTTALKALAANNGATLFMVLQTAFSILLARYSSREDVVIGTPIANRNYQEIENLVGFFVNSLALRTDLSGNPDFKTLLTQTRRVALDAYAHQDLPFERVVDALNLERDLSRNPLFQVMFALQNAPIEETNFSGVTIAPLNHKRISAQFDLVLDMWETDDFLTGVLEYSTDLFDQSSIARMVGHFLTLLQGIVAKPHTPALKLPMLTNSELAQLEEWSGFKRSYPTDQCWHHLFEKKVIEVPQKICGIHGDHEMTYAQLQERANRLANGLLNLGVGPKQFVGILAPRSLDFLSAIVGILKAGGAYVPLDPDQGTQRNSYMLRDSGMHVLITWSHLYQELPLECLDQIRHVIFLDSGNPNSIGEPQIHLEQDFQDKTTPATAVVASDAAYMLYTSGSTGKPKGAVIRHNGMVNHIYAEAEDLKLDDAMVFLQSASACSDISVWQFLGPLLLGGQTVIADYETVCDPPKLLELIQKRGVTLIELVPVVLNALLNEARELGWRAENLPHLAWAMVTGEAAPVPLVNRWFQIFPTIPLINAYGPTEASDDVCQHILREPLPDSALAVPIGKPVANMRLYVLDERLERVPQGVPGEICVAGIGVGPGYHGQPERTRSAFVANPYARDEHEAVLYRTGDLGCWLSGGVLGFADRLDNQVKIRGFRIEPGEIEATLGTNPLVTENAVIISENALGEKELVAFVVPDDTVLENMEKPAQTQVELWKDLHENSYQDQLLRGDDPTFNVIGWDSNYTGQPLSEEEMHEYVDHTVNRIRKLNPQHLIEIGCGTGLILFKIVPHLQSYLGMDLSEVAINQLRSLCNDPDLEKRIPGLARVELACEAAHQCPERQEQPDTVIFPSVVQYFPSIEYMDQVLVQLLETIKSGGSIFIGDVRDLSLLRVFHASVLLYKSENEATGLAQQLEATLNREQELAISPEYFLDLEQRFSRVSHVEILPKGGHHLNEMTRFRYDVVLHLDGEPIKRQPQWLAWQADRHTLQRISERLAAGVEELALSNVMNKRCTADQHALEEMYKDPSLTTYALLQGRASLPVQGLDPTELIELGESHGYEVHLHMTENHGQLNVVFSQPHLSPPCFHGTRGGEPLASYANNPLQEKQWQQVPNMLLAHMKEHLPSHMQPTRYLCLSQMPLTPNGKIDRFTLAKDSRLKETSGGGQRQPPITPMEIALAGIWAEVLGLDVNEVGRDDNFFSLGGHSLKATLIVSRVARDLGRNMPLRDMFEKPTIAELANALGETEQNVMPIPKLPDADRYPVSHAQKRLWVLSRMEEGSAAYHMPSSLILEGMLDRNGIAQALRQLIDRHEILRTHFVLSQEGTLFQKVEETVPLPLSFQDATGWSEDERNQQVAKFHSQPFDLTCSPLLRMQLIELEPRKHLLLICCHHIISDGWSETVMVREFMQAYAAARTGGDSALPPLPIQYRDYASWQSASLSEASKDYWHERLSGITPLHLAYDAPRPAVKTYNGDVFGGYVTLRPLQQLARDEQKSMFVLLSALCSLMLHRYSAQDDFTMGTPLAGRNHPDLEDQIGFYVNTLILRMQLDPQQTLTAFLADHQRNVQQALQHGDYPFNLLADELAKERDPSRQPLFDVMVVLQDPDAVDLDLEGLTVRPFYSSNPTSQFDLTFSFQERPEGLWFAIVYNTDLFQPGRIKRMHRHFKVLAEAVAENPTTPLVDLPMLHEDEYRKLLVDFNDTNTSYPSEETLVGLIAKQAELTPQGTALVIDQTDQTLTYKELIARAADLATALIGHYGVERGDRVALLLKPDVPAITAMLAVLSIGASYVPLDPDHPPERLRFIVEDCTCQIVLCDAESLNQIDAPILDQLTTVDVASIPKQDGPLINMAHPHDPAYVIYTSGTTGKPKGCVVSHQNVVRLLVNEDFPFQFRNDDVWILAHSICFDFSVWEIYGALVYGGKLVIPQRTSVRDAIAFRSLLEKYDVSVLNQTPAAFNNLIEVERDQALKLQHLRYVIFGGDRLEPANLRDWISWYPLEQVSLVNMYGITETTVHVTYGPLKESDIHSGKAISPIGVPLPDTKILILDRQGRLQPIGVPGEIYVSGGGVSAGYLNRDLLTSERFPHLHRDGQRWLKTSMSEEPCYYRSGDMGKWREDGTLEHMGRNDHQVQIRGFRIELEEIEAVLLQEPRVREVSVLAVPFPDGPQLTAFIASDHEPDVLRPPIQAHLSRYLPDYMVPSRLLFSQAMPLTQNSKIDRKALIARAQEGRPIASEKTATSALDNSIAETIMQAWTEVLGRTDIDWNEGFFEAGGHSLHVIRLHRLLQERFDTHLEVVDLFRHSTIASQCQLFESGENQRSHRLQTAGQERAKRKRSRRRNDK